MPYLVDNHKFASTRLKITAADKSSEQTVAKDALGWFTVEEESQNKYGRMYITLIKYHIEKTPTQTGDTDAAKD